MVVIDQAFPVGIPRVWCADLNADIGTKAKQSGSLVLEGSL